MSEDSKTPKAKVELEKAQVRPASFGEKDPGAGNAAGNAGAAGGDAQPTGDYAKRVSSWVSRAFPGHEKAFWGGVCGLLVAIVLFALGLLRTIIIVVLVGVGIALGQMADGDPKLIKLIRKFFSGVD